MNLGLVDMIWLSIHPVILGGGKPIFEPLKNRVNLKLVETQSFDTGLVSVTYDLK